jgi:hypothetical protein
VQQKQRHIATDLVVVVEVDPPTESLDGIPPFSSMLHDDSSTLGIVFFNAHCKDTIPARDTELLVDFELNWHSVSIPPEAPDDMAALH